MLTALAGILLVAVATSLGWGLRGVWGHWWGATVPGAFCGMSLWLAFGQTHDAWQMLLLGAALAASFSIGGKLSYIRIVGYVQTRGAKDPHAPGVRRDMYGEESDTRYDRSPLYGLFAIFVVGGLWGFFGGAPLGILMTDVSYDFTDLALWAVLAFIGAFLAYKLLVVGLDMHLSPPKPDNWAIMLGGAISTALFFAFGPHDMVVLGTALFGCLGCGIGFVIGVLIHRRCVMAGKYPYSWKFMECSVGFWGGLALAASVALTQGEIAAVPASTSTRLLSILAVLWLVPYLNTSASFQYWSLERSWLSRRTFALFQVLAAALLVSFLTLAPDIVNGWEGTSLHYLPFVGMLIYMIFLGLILGLPRPRQLLLKWGAVKGMYVGMAATCLLLLLPLL